MRAVLDPNVLVSAVLSRAGAPAELLAHWRYGGFELVVSGVLREELERVLAHPKLRRLVDPEDAAAFVELLRQHAIVAPDRPVGEHHSPDAADDYLLALAEAERALLVSGDRHLLELEDLPILTARAFLDSLDG